MGIIEAIKRGFAIATKSLGLVFVLFAFNLIWNLASIPLAQAGAAATPQLTTSAIILSVAFILASIFVQGGALGMVRDSIKGGGMKLGNFFSYGLKYYIRLFMLGLIIVLIIGIVGLVAALIVAVTAPLNNIAVTVVATIIALAIGVIGLYLIVRLIMAPYSLVCNDMGVIESMKNSIKVVGDSLYYKNQFKWFKEDMILCCLIIGIVTLIVLFFPTEIFPPELNKAIAISLIILAEFLLLLIGALLFGSVFTLLFVLIHLSLIIGFFIGFLTGLITAPMAVATGQVIIGVVNSAFNGYLGIVMMASFTLLYLALSGKEKA